MRDEEPNSELDSVLIISEPMEGVPLQNEGIEKYLSRNSSVVLPPSECDS